MKPSSERERVSLTPALHGETNLSGSNRWINETTRLRFLAAVDAVAAFASSMPADVNLGLAVFNRGQIRELLPIGRVDERRLALSWLPRGDRKRRTRSLAEFHDALQELADE